MKRFIVCSLAISLTAACSRPASIANNPTAPTAPDGSSRNSIASVASVSVPENFRAHLNGKQVVPALPIPTLAQGEAVLQVSVDGSAIAYKVIVANIENVVNAHLHMGAVGDLGPRVARLMPILPPAGGRTDGILVEGTLTTGMLTGPLAGHPLSDLIDAFQAGNVYVDIPTNDGVDPRNNAPGDYRTGELRGQVH